MKSKVVVFNLVLFFFVVSCNEDNSNSVVQNETVLEIKIPLTSVGLKSLNSISGNAGIDYTFSGSQEYSPENLSGTDSGIQSIRSVTFLSGSVLLLPDFSESNELYSLKLEWGLKTSGEETYMMQESIDLLALENVIENNNNEINLDKALIKLAGKINDYPYYSFIFNITGNSNFNLKGTAQLNIPVQIESETYDTQFSVF